MRAINHSDAHLVLSVPGFEILQNEENGAYYFKCNDLHGKTILWSKDYPTLKIAENNLHHALRLAKHPKNYIQKQDGLQFSFLLESNHHPELAKSLFFKSEQEMQNALNYLTQVANLTKPMQKPTAQEVVKEHQPKLEPITKSQAKYAFTINLYPQPDGQSFLGRIEYLLTQETSNFKGIDASAMATFIEQHLPKVTNPAPIDIEKVAQATLQLLSAPQGKPVQSVLVGSPSLFLKLNIKESEQLEKEWQLSISAHPIGSNTITMRTKSKAILQSDGDINITLPGSSFTQGFYRLEIEAHTATYKVQANCLFQVY